MTRDYVLARVLRERHSRHAALDALADDPRVAGQAAAASLRASARA
jgi:hypothetical protein